MANGAPRRPGALGRSAAKSAATTPAGFNADERSATRQATPVTIGGRAFRRLKKDWDVTRVMRRLMRLQESAIAKSGRLGRRIAELEAEQVEAAANGEDVREEELEQKIAELVTASDEATEDAELVTYRLIALLLEPTGEDAPAGFGVTDVDSEEWVPAVEFLQPELDVEDAAGLARELTGSQDQDPQPTPSSGSGST